MSTKLIKRAKAYLMVALMGTMIVGQCYMPMIGELQAATINTSANKGGIAQVKVKDTTVTITSISEWKYKGKYKVCYEIEREKGLPDQATDIAITGKISFSVGNKKYELILWGDSLKIQSESANKFYAEAIGECSADGGKTLERNLNPTDLNGKAATFTVSKIVYSNVSNLYNFDLVDYLKKEDQANSVPFAEGALVINYEPAIADAPNAQVKAAMVEMKKKELETRPVNVLPDKGLALQILSKDLGKNIDNIGFVDGKLHMRIKGNNGAFWPLSILDATGRNTIIYSEYDKTNNVRYCIYNVKSAEDLAKCKIEWKEATKLIAEEATKSNPMTIKIS